MVRRSVGRTGCFVLKYSVPEPSTMPQNQFMIRGIVLIALSACPLALPGCNRRPVVREPPGLPLAGLEDSLRPISLPLGPIGPGDWLSAHQEDRQTFAQYLQLRPKRRSNELTTIYLLLLGDFSPEQREILETTQRYLGVFYQTPVKVHRELPLVVIPDEGRRT